MIKTLDNFIKKHQGWAFGYPEGKYIGECLSIVKIYIKECFNINPPPSGSNSAFGYWSNFPQPLPTVFKKIAISATTKPKKGDIIIWNTNTGGGFGHIAIYISGFATEFTSFDQNWNGKEAHLQIHDYKNIVGWLTPIKQENDTIPEMATWLVNLLNENGVDVSKPEGEVRPRVQEIIDGWKKYAESEKRIANLEKDLAGARGEAAEYETRLQTLEQGRETARKEIEDLRQQVVTRDSEINRLERRVETLETSSTGTSTPSTNLIIKILKWIFRRK